MVYESAGLIALLVVLVIYVRLRKRNNKLEDNGLKAQTAELRQIRKQLQQANNLFTTFVVQLLAGYKQIEAELNVANSKNESLKQTVQKLQQQLASVESERDEAREALTKLRFENTLLERKVEQLESHKKVLIQELCGSLSSQDIEFITWKFLIQKVKEVTNHLNEVIAYNQSLLNTNRELQQERDTLRRDLNYVKDDNTRLMQDKLQLRDKKVSLEIELRRTLDRIKPLEKAKDKLEQEKTQLERKISELNQVESKLRKAEAEIEQLEEEVEELEQTKNHLELELKQEKAKVTSFEQKQKDLEKVKNQLDAELKQEKAKVVRLEQKNKNLEQFRNQLETALKQERSRVAVLERETNGLGRGKNEGGSERENSTEGNDGLLRKISDLNQTIKQLEDKVKQLEYKPYLDSSVQEQKHSNRYYSQPDICDEVDLLEQYNNLVYFVQECLSCSGIEELEDWGKTEEFYVELISRICFIDTILITKIESLEANYYYLEDDSHSWEDNIYLISNKNNHQGLAVTPSYPGKFLFWSNGEVRWELSSFFNSKL